MAMASNVVRVITRSIVVGIIRNVKKPNRAFKGLGTMLFLCACKRVILLGNVKALFESQWEMGTRNLFCHKYYYYL